MDTSSSTANEAQIVRHVPASHDVVPECLRERRQWVCWKYIDRDGKQTKPPINAKTGRKASSTDPATWATFDQAIAACDRYPDLAGVGFVFAPDDPFAGIDLDNCLDPTTGEIKPWARRFLDQLDSYSEISPSGGGVKVFVRATQPDHGRKCNYEDGAVEMYDSGRYFTVTGQRLPDFSADVEQRQDRVEAMHKLVFGGGQRQGRRRTSMPVVEKPVSLTDEQVLEKARAARNGARFSALFDQGDTSAHGGDASAADLALCSILAFWTRNKEQLDRLFRRSALMREKWDEKHYGDGRTYGQGTIDKAIESATETYRQSKRGNRALPGVIDYRATADGLVWDKPTQHGSVPTPLTNFTARIIADVSRDDGVETSHVFTLEAELHGRRCRFDVPSGKFAALSWVTESLGARAIVYPGFSAKDHTRVAIQMLSDDIVTQAVYTHLGWRKVADRYVYLHAGGAIAPETPIAPGIEVDPGPELARFRFPSPPRDKRAIAAVSTSLRMLELAADDVILPVFAAIWRSVLGPCDFTMHLSGGSGTFKTELAALAQQHFGAELDARNLPGSWSSTGNSLEALAFIAKDALLVVDDFAPTGTQHDVARLHREAARLIRAQGNRSGRGRMRSDATLRPSKCPRGLILSTGEDVPASHSVRARIGVVEVEGGTISQPQLTRCQKDARQGLYAEAMAAFVYWLSSRYGELNLSQEVAELRERAYREASAHRRTPAMVASLFVGIRYFTRFAHEIGVFDDSEAAAFENRGWDSLGAFAAAQASHLQSVDPIDRFCTLLASALASGRAHVADPRGEAPEQGGPDDETSPTSWGWRRVTVGSGEHARDEWMPQGDRVGWYDAARDDLYLDIESAVRLAQAAAPGGTDGISLAPRTLAKRLNERRLLRSTDESRGKNTVQRVLQGQRRNVVHLETSAITCGLRAQRAHRAHDPASGRENANRAPETCAPNSADTELRAHVRAHSQGHEGSNPPIAPEAPVMGGTPPAQVAAPTDAAQDEVAEDMEAAKAVLAETLPGLKVNARRGGPWD